MISTTTAKDVAKTISEKSLTEFHHDIIELSQRVQQLEDERHLWQALVEKDKQLVDHLNFKTAREDSLINAHDEDIKSFQQIFTDLKHPVEKVVNNLNQVFAGIKDSALQSSIQDCISTAQIVQNSFEVTQAGLAKFTKKHSSVMIATDIRTFISSLFSVNFQTKRFKLFAEQEIKAELAIQPEVLKNALIAVSEKLLQATNSSSIIAIKLKRMLDSELDSKVGLGHFIEMSVSEPSKMKWKDSWAQSFTINNLTDSWALDWLAQRHILKKFNGDLELVLDADSHVTGVIIKIPEQYSLPFDIEQK